MMLNTVVIMWFLCTFVQIWLGSRCRRWTAWIIPAFFLAFAVYFCSYYFPRGEAADAQIMVCLPCLWLPAVFYTAYYYKKWKQLR